MPLFTSLVLLLLVAIALLWFSRPLHLPYPTTLAVAGVVVAALPGPPDITINPELALALFIAPALMDAGYGVPPRALRRQWLPLIALAAVATLLTAGAVAVVGVWMAAMPIAAALALGAIIAPPDAAAASAMLSRLPLPRRLSLLLKGESLLNDAVALVLYAGAVAAVVEPWHVGALLPLLALAVPGGVVLGLMVGGLYLFVRPYLADTLSGRLLEFVATFALWLLAEKLHLSAVLAVVSFGMLLSRFAPARQSALDRAHSTAVWEAALFMLNVVAFLLMGLQARAILLRIDGGHLWFALGFAAVVSATVILVRLAWIALFNHGIQAPISRRSRQESLSPAQELVLAWCGMRGIVTLAMAMALPADFPQRDLIVLTALAVVLTTLVVQGPTLLPLIHLLGFKEDDSFKRELRDARLHLLDTACAALEEREGPDAAHLRAIYDADKAAAKAGHEPRAVSASDQLHQETVRIQRARLQELRHTGAIEDDVYHLLEQELDWAELSVTPATRQQLLEG